METDWPDLLDDEKRVDERQREIERRLFPTPREKAARYFRWLGYLGLTIFVSCAAFAAAAALAIWLIRLALGY